MGDYKPRTKDELKKIIIDHFRFGFTDLNDIDTSLITDMSCLFGNTKHDFNVSEWDTRNVEDMAEIFYGCHLFNSNIGNWNTGNVKNMFGMFLDCYSFNQDIGRWNVGNVRNMSGLFLHCKKFNQDLSCWNVRNLKYTAMFRGCLSMSEKYKPKYTNLYGKAV